MIWRSMPMGDAALAIVFDERVDPSVNARCIALAGDLERRDLPGVRDIVPGFHTVSVYFDPLRTDRQRLQTEMESAAAAQPDGAPPESSLIEISVKYGGEDGPDLTAIAAFAGCSEQEVIRLHSSAVYRVYMLGFLPGFAYLATVPRQIAMPRLQTPRARVPAGSVGIAGLQTGLYPCDTPGGWRIVGRASAKLFDPDRQRPLLMQAGDHVKFVAV